jgi:hypothetical protein
MTVATLILIVIALVAIALTTALVLRSGRCEPPGFKRTLSSSRPRGRMPLPWRQRPMGRRPAQVVPDGHGAERDG